MKTSKKKCKAIQNKERNPTGARERIIKKEIREKLFKMAEKFTDYDKFENEIVYDWQDWMQEYVDDYEKRYDFKVDFESFDQKQKLAVDLIYDSIKEDLHQIYFEAHEEEILCSEELLEKAEEILEIYKKYAKSKVK